MAAGKFTIYMLTKDSELDFEETVYEIVDTFNKNADREDQKFQPKTNTELELEYNENYKLYTRAAETNPDWSDVLVDLVTDLDAVKNINYSYVLFITLDNKLFAVTGGAGYHLINRYKKLDFGLDLLSRLIDEDDNVIKRVQDKFFYW